ncbi:hypothetical protein BYT27DRAFT_7192658 [Phlegmacium glaucopus]|nr:hypothetical protein BYT27DRAFT_7192658 [Phlegmacium glaucopus]
MFSLSSNINFSLRSSDTLGAGQHSTHAEANVLSAYCSGSVLTLNIKGIATEI